MFFFLFSPSYRRTFRFKSIPYILPNEQHFTIIRFQCNMDCKKDYPSRIRKTFNPYKHNQKSIKTAPPLFTLINSWQQIQPSPVRHCPSLKQSPKHSITSPSNLLPRIQNQHLAASPEKKTLSSLPIKQYQYPSPNFPCRARLSYLATLHYPPRRRRRRRLALTLSCFAPLSIYPAGRYTLPRPHAHAFALHVNPAKAVSTRRSPALMEHRIHFSLFPFSRPQLNATAPFPIFPSLTS